MKDTEKTGALAAAKGQVAVISEFGWYWRDQPVLDVGIDAIIELSSEGSPTGRMIGVQVKGGESHNRNGYIAVDIKHWDYWQGCTLPMIFVWHSPKDESLTWVELSASNKQPSGKNVKLPLRNFQPLTESARIALEKIAYEWSQQYSPREVDLAWDAGIFATGDDRRHSFVYQIRGIDDAERRVVTALSLIDNGDDADLIGELGPRDVAYLNRLLKVTQNMDLSRQDDAGLIARVRQETTERVEKLMANEDS